MKYTTRDCHVKYHGEMIEPYTTVDVDPEDLDSWEQLVKMHLADRGTPVEEEPTAEPEMAPEEQMPEPEILAAVEKEPKSKRTKKQ